MLGIDKFEDVIAGIDWVVVLKKRRGFALPINLHVRTNDREKALGHHLRARLAAAGVRNNDVLSQFSDWSGIVTPSDIPKDATLIRQDNATKSNPCLFPSTYMMVMSNGRIADAPASTARGIASSAT